MDLSRSSMWLHQTMEDDDSALLRYLIAEDRPNYELLLDDDDDEDMVPSRCHSPWV
jgi:hypothetical protein